MIWKDSCFWKKSYDKFRQCIKKQKHYFADKGPYVKSILFPVVMYWHESWTIKKDECWKIDASKLWRWRRLVRVPWTVNKSSQSILKKKKNQPWIFIGRTDTKAEAPILWPPDMKHLIIKDPDVKKDWRQKKRAAEDEMVKEYHQLKGQNLSKLRETVEDRETWWAAVQVIAKNQTRQQLKSNNKIS